MQQLIHQRGRLADLKAARGNVDRLVADVFTLLRVDPDETVDGLTAAACEEGAFDRAGLMLALQAWSQSSDAEQKKARRLAEWLAADPARRGAALAGPSFSFLPQQGATPHRFANKPPPPPLSPPPPPPGA